MVRLTRDLSVLSACPRACRTLPRWNSRAVSLRARCSSTCWLLRAGEATNARRRVHLRDSAQHQDGHVRGEAYIETAPALPLLRITGVWLPYD